MRSDQYQVLRRRYPLLFAVFIFCFVLAIDTIYRDLRGVAPTAMCVKYPLALLMTASAFIGASMRIRRIEKAEKSNQKLEPTP